MARYSTCGFELQSPTAGVELSGAGLNNNGTGGGGIVTTGQRSGSACMKINVSASFSWFEVSAKASGASTADKLFIRAYVYFNAFPSSATTEIIATYNLSQRTAVVCVTTGGVIQLRQVGPAGTQIGSNGPTLSLSTWYRVEMEVSGGTGNATLKARVDGTEFAASTTATVVNFGRVLFGNGGTSSTYNLLYDDIAINNTSGSAQTSYPGEGKVVIGLPSAAGDANTFATQTGGTAGAGNNYTRVDEVPPDDATSFNGSSTLNEEDFFNITDSLVGTSDTVNVVNIGFRFRNSTADNTGAIKVEVKKAASGTILQSAAIVPNATTWRTNTISSTDIGVAPLVTYTDPDGAAWNSTTINSMQIGYKLTTGPATPGRRCDVSTVWAMIDYTPSSTAIATVDGLAKASVATVDGLAIASVSSVNGLA